MLIVEDEIGAHVSAAGGTFNAPARASEIGARVLLRHVPKVIETPKGDDALAADRANLARLRGYRSSKKSAETGKE